MWFLDAAATRAIYANDTLGEVGGGGGGGGGGLLEEDVWWNSWDIRADGKWNGVWVI